MLSWAVSYFVNLLEIHRIVKECLLEECCILNFCCPQPFAFFLSYVYTHTHTCPLMGLSHIYVDFKVE